MTRNRPTRVTASLALTFAAALVWASTAAAIFAGGGKKPENDCLIVYDGIDASDVVVDGKKQTVTCVDCDPACDHDDVTEPNGSCTFQLGACINEPGVEGCTPPAFLDKASASAKVKGVKGKILIEVPQLLEGSVCGALLDIEVATKETNQGAKDGKGTVKLSAKQNKDKDEGIDKKRSDKDKITVICAPRPVGEDCPSDTTTTTTTSTTTTTAPPCGNGTIDTGEECDPNAEPTGCGAGLTCVTDCTCKSCVAPSGADPTTLTFTTGTGTTDCGPVGFTPTQPAPPHSGSVADGSGTEISPLGLGCLYIGGGNSMVPGGVTPDSAPNTYAIDLICDAGDTLQLGGSAGTGSSDCSLAAGPATNCVNGHPGTDGNGACTSDEDCRPLCVDIVCHDGGPNDGQPCNPSDTAFCAPNACYGNCVNGAPGLFGSGECKGAGSCGIGSEILVCLPVANCFFGPPLPVRNGGLSTCVDNVFIQDGSGSASVSTGEINLIIPLQSRVHLTGNGTAPCPQCLGGTCAVGENAGGACTGVGADATTHDCEPNEYDFLAPLAVTLSPLTTGLSTLPPDGTPSADGLFCPGQPTAGAFHAPSTRLVTEQGAPASSGLDTTAKAATLASSFCIPQTGNLLIDGSANLPGPGATSLGGTVQLGPTL